MTLVSPGIRQDLDPRAWPSHRFGLSEARWCGLAARAAWITGAGTGYGRALAFGLAAAGATVVLSGRRRDKLEDSLAEMATLGVATGRCYVVPADITDPAQVAAAAAEVARRVPALDVLVNSAALPEPAVQWPLMELAPTEWSRLVATNVTGSWLVTRAALPLLLRGGAARVLFLSSEAGWASTPGFGPYNVSKAALNSLACSFAAEVAARYPGLDAQVNALDPGEARTEMNRGSSESPYAAVPMALALLSHPPGGPNGRFFHRDGRHLAFAHAQPWERAVTDAPQAADGQNKGAMAFGGYGGNASRGPFGALLRRILRGA